LHILVYRWFFAKSQLSHPCRSVLSFFRFLLRFAGFLLLLRFFLVVFFAIICFNLLLFHANGWEIHFVNLLIQNLWFDLMKRFDLRGILNRLLIRLVEHFYFRILTRDSNKVQWLLICLVQHLNLGVLAGRVKQRYSLVLNCDIIFRLFEANSDVIFLFKFFVVWTHEQKFSCLQVQNPVWETFYCLLNGLVD